MFLVVYWEGTPIDGHQAIEQQRRPSVSVLDNRAATYTKLEDLQAALRDGRQMIHVGKTDVTVWIPACSTFTCVLTRTGLPSNGQDPAATGQRGRSYRDLQVWLGECAVR